jgi:hypothetical protein
MIANSPEAAGYRQSPKASARLFAASASFPAARTKEYPVQHFSSMDLNFPGEKYFFRRGWFSSRLIIYRIYRLNDDHTGDCSCAARPTAVVSKSVHTPATTMTSFNYRTQAELFFVGSKGTRGQPVGYKRFAEAAYAVRFAIEKVRPELLRGACLEVDETRYDRDGIRRLYNSADYPLPRRAAGRGAVNR